MSRLREEAILAAPRRDAALTAAVLALTAAVFALAADHGILAHVQHVDAWLRLMISTRSAPSAPGRRGPRPRRASRS
jgi:hypothetical protein